jgi:hypothetical protein
MSLPDARMRVLTAHRDLLRVWFSVEEQWRDANAREFKARVMEPAESMIRSAASGMEQMEGEMAKLRRECEIEGRI